MEKSTEEGFIGSTRKTAALTSTMNSRPRQAIRFTHGLFELRGLGTAMMQEHDGKYNPVAYGNKKFTNG